MTVGIWLVAGLVSLPVLRRVSIGGRRWRSSGWRCLPLGLRNLLGSLVWLLLYNRNLLPFFRSCRGLLFRFIMGITGYL